MLEYEEKFQQFWGAEITTNLLGALLTAPNTSLHAIFYNFRLVGGDADDDKFADAYLAANADYLVSNDTALLLLNRKTYPVIQVLKLEDFAALIV